MIIFCGIDPGFSGGISILSNSRKALPVVYKMPVIKLTKKVKGKIKTKRLYDLQKIRDIFVKHLSEKSMIVLERVSSMPGEGSVSSFAFGKGFGNLEGIVMGLFNHLPIIVSSQKWKKQFSELITDGIIAKKAEIRDLRVLSKSLEEKQAKNENKKQIDKLNRQVKAESKTAARSLVSTLYPKMAKVFEKTNTDGMAESLLIALYGKENRNELVQNS